MIKQSIHLLISINLKDGLSLKIKYLHFKLQLTAT